MKIAYELAQDLGGIQGPLKINWCNYANSEQSLKATMPSAMDWATWSTQYHKLGGWFGKNK